MIAYRLLESATVRLAVYDVLGRQVAVLVNGPVQSGSHEITFDGHGLASGIYIYRLDASGRVVTGKMMLMK